MNGLIILLMLTIGISACSDQDHGPDADHSHTDEKPFETTERAIAQTPDDHGHEQSEDTHAHGDDHDHPHGDDDEHAPETEAFYRDDAENVEEPSESKEDHEPHGDHAYDRNNKSHEEGDHDHHH